MGSLSRKMKETSLPLNCESCCPNWPETYYSLRCLLPAFHLQINPLTLRRSLEDTSVPFHWNFNSILRRDHQKNFLWSSGLWVGRRKEPILGYVLKYDEKKNLVLEGLTWIHLQYWVINILKYKRITITSYINMKYMLKLSKHM